MRVSFAGMFLPVSAKQAGGPSGRGRTRGFGAPAWPMRVDQGGGGGRPDGSRSSRPGVGGLMSCVAHVGKNYTLVNGHVKKKITGGNFYWPKKSRRLGRLIIREGNYRDFCSTVS